MNILWTKDEDDQVRFGYPKFGSKCLKINPNKRNINAVQLRAKKLGVFFHKKWTKEEKDILRSIYPLNGACIDLRKKLGRGKSCIWKMAKSLGIYKFKVNSCEYNKIAPVQKTITGQYWSSITHSAKIRGLDFLITKEYAWNLFENCSRKCALSGIDINLRKNYKDFTQTASLDRIDSSKGYIEGNVQWVHKNINKMKWNFPNNQFINYCKLVAVHSSK